MFPKNVKLPFWGGRKHTPNTAIPVGGVVPEAPADEFPPNDITFEIKEADVIFRAVKRGQEKQIAFDLMESPVESVAIKLTDNAGKLELESEVKYSTDKRELVDNTLKKTIERLTKDAEARGESTMERGNQMIIPSANKTRLVIGKGDWLRNELYVSTGRMDKGLFSKYSVIPSPDFTKENFKSALADTVGALALILNTSYDEADKYGYKQHIVISPEGGYEEQLGSEGETEPQEMSSKFGAERPRVSFEEIGGQDAAKVELQSLAKGIADSKLWRKWGTKLPKGILLYGPPGTGKTLLAKAVASQAKARFVYVRATDITSVWYGNSEKHMQELFDGAPKDKKTIIYFDEIDALVPDRNGAHEATQRVISTLLQNIDGMESKDNIFIIASTNRKDSLDPAFIRPGRLDRLIYVGMPNEVGRQEAFRIHMGKAVAVAKSKGNRIFDENIDMQQLALATDNYSGADIAEIVRRTLEGKVRQEIETGVTPGPVSTEDVMRELKNYERALALSMARKPEAIEPTVTPK